MEFSPNKSYSAYGRVDSFNTSDSIINMVVTLEDDTQVNIKLKNNEQLQAGKVYLLNFDCIFNGARNQLVLKDFKDVALCPLTMESEAAMKKFYPYVKVGIRTLEEKLDQAIEKIKNQIIKDIVVDIFKRYRHDFLIYPAATKMHHNYIGGLAYHTLTMVDLAIPFAHTYDCLDLDLIIGGILLHDITKTIEFNHPVEDKYSIRGQLLGHLVLGALEIEKTAERLGYLETEEVMLLEHIVVSHHGQMQFGACRRPETPEAVIVWLIDTIDSKMRVVEENMFDLEPGTISDAIGVLERTKLYKRK